MRYQVVRVVAPAGRLILIPYSTWLTHRRAYDLMTELKQEFPYWSFALVDTKGNWQFKGPNYYDKP